MNGPAHRHARRGAPLRSRSLCAHSKPGLAVAVILTVVACSGSDPGNAGNARDGGESGSGSSGSGSGGTTSGSSGGASGPDAAADGSSSSSSGCFTDPLCSGGGTSSGGSSGSGSGTTRDGGIADANAVEGGGLTDASIDRSVGDGGGTPCGSRTCPAGQYCCSSECGLCVPLGARCVQACDGGINDASMIGCTAQSQGDALCAGSGLPHYYGCVLVGPPSNCTIIGIGNVVTQACCP